jgi:hypothetical protein
MVRLAAATAHRTPRVMARQPVAPYRVELLDLHRVSPRMHYVTAPLVIVVVIGPTRTNGCDRRPQSRDLVRPVVWHGVVSRNENPISLGDPNE